MLYQYIIFGFTIVLPFVIIIIFWSKLLEFSKKKPYLLGALIGIYIGVITSEIHGFKLMQGLENSVTDSIITNFTNANKNSKKVFNPPKKILATLFDEDILKKLENNIKDLNEKIKKKGNNVKKFNDIIKKIKNNKILLEKSYIKNGNYYHLNEKLDKKDITEVTTILKSLSYAPGKNSLVVYAIISTGSLKLAESLYDMGWPWRRETYGKIVNFLDKSGASVFIFDFIYSEKSVYRSKPIEKSNFPTIYNEIQKIDKTINKIYRDDDDDNHFSKFISNTKKGSTIFGFDVGSPESKIYKIYHNKPYKKIEEEAKKNKIPTDKGYNKKQLIKMILKAKYIKKYIKEIESYALPLNTREFEKNSSISLEHYYSVNPPFKEYLKKVKYIASIIATQDFDGLYRRLPLVWKYNNKYYPTLSFASYLAYKENRGEKIVKLKMEGNKLITYINKNDKLIIDRKIPLDNEGNLRLKYYGWANKDGSEYFDINMISIYTLQDKISKLYAAYNKAGIKPIYEDDRELCQNISKYYEMLNTIKDKIDEKTFNSFKLGGAEKKIINADLEGKLIMFATIAPGLLDLRPTPFLEKEAGAHLHISSLDNILQNDFLSETPSIFMIISIILISILIGVLTAGNSMIRSALTWFILTLIIVGSGIVLFVYGNIIYDITIPIFSVFLVFLFDSIIDYFAEQKEKGYIKGAFGQYLSPKVIDIIMNDPSKLALGGQRKIITAFFSDVAGFSTISEKLTPDELVALLNDYLTDMCDIAAKYDGTVDKFEGDAIIAFWGAPLDEAEHAKLACYTTIEMQERLGELRKIWTAENRDPLIANMRMRVGLNSGPAVIGNMGSKNRMDYTMMGDTVNLAARLEGANKFYGTFSMISDATYVMAKDSIEVRELDKIQVVGKKEAVIVYELLAKKGGTTGAKADGVAQYIKAMELYKQQKFEEAIKNFESVYKHIPNDPPSKTYIERCKVLKDNPPGPDWDGRYVLTSKG
ncbi:MAG: CHASE2 domain-containing protein [Spirochaetota bacterium]|nr:CHASE2 domain-containing protein [Spirochaetota bacterium]